MKLDTILKANTPKSSVRPSTRIKYNMRKSSNTPKRVFRENNKSLLDVSKFNKGNLNFAEIFPL
jgi:hypothetical protein